MQTNVITIVIECNGKEYGLIVPRTATIRQVKKEIEVFSLQTCFIMQTHLGIPLSDQVLCFQSVILDNDKTMVHYGIDDESELVLKEDAFRNHLVNKDVELVELNTWLDMLNSDYDEIQKIIREADYIIGKIHDLEGKYYGLDVVDNALSYVN